ncbi:hypothetical protein [Spirulina subsalsa]|uniref:hypothetical protein n=1 Tax=Spirulina subsalsa TaxID=54311 RepID=UPI0003085A23|nr:hypothetical protein [Spirulina subsalsa]
MPWFPFNQYIWDFWFTWQNSTLHLFYLQAPPSHCHYNPENRHNQAVLGHSQLTPWGWQTIPHPQPAFSPGKPGTWDDLAIWTGSIIQQEQKYYLFYTGRRREDAPQWTPHEWQRPQHIGLATSEDLRHWERFPHNPILPNPGTTAGLDGVAWRDPYIIQGEDKRYYAFICTRSGSAPLDRGGMIVYCVSDHLEQWDNSSQILIESSEFYQMEVPQVFWHKSGNFKRLYLIFSAQAKDCSAQRYKTDPSQCITGTYYQVSEPVSLDCQELPPLITPAKVLISGLYAGKFVQPERENPALFYGFHWSEMGGHFGNGLSDPLWFKFQGDGSISKERTISL